MGEGYLESGAELEATPWAPSRRLRRSLATAIGATLLAAVFLLAESALAMTQQQGWVTGAMHVLGWLALVPGVWITLTYAALGEETRYRSLTTSSVGLLMALVLFQLSDLIGLELLPWYGQVVLWVVFVLGLICAVIWPFIPSPGAATTAKAGALQAADADACRSASSSLESGQRVLGHYCKSGRWYAGLLQSIRADAFHITYDDGDTETVPGECIVAENLTPPDQLASGDRVLARWWGMECYYAGVVTETRPGEAHITYDDGDKEWCKLPAVRLPGSGTASPANTDVASSTSDLEATGGGLAGKFWGLMGGVGLAVILILVRVVGKGAVRFAMRRGAQVLPGGVDWLEIVGAILLGILAILAVIYFVWFAVAKIVARSRLGPVAVLLGLAELLGLLAVLAIAGWFMAQFAILAMEPGVTDEQMEQLAAQLGGQVAPISAVLTIGWAALTMWLFWSVRSRHDPDAELHAADRAY
jgi:hypothetical protein